MDSSPTSSPVATASRRGAPLALKFALDLLLVALLPLALVTWLFLSRGRAELERAAKVDMTLHASLTAARVDQLVIDSTRSVQQVALDDDVIEMCTTPDQADALRPHVMQRLNAVTSTNPDFASAFVVNAKGTGLASTNPKNVGQDLSFREYVQAALKGEMHVSDMIVGKTTGAPGIYFAAPVRAMPPGPTTGPATAPTTTPAGPVLGAVVIKLNAKAVWDIVAAPKLGRQGYALLTDRNGIIVAHRDPSLLWHSLEPLSAARQAVVNPEVNFSIARIDSIDALGLEASMTGPDPRGDTSFGMASPGEPRGGVERWVAGFTSMQQKPWKVAVVQPEAQLHEATASTLTRLVGVAAGVGLIAIALAIWRARKLVKPIVELSRAAGTLAAGDFSARVSVRGSDELARLGNAFNQMVPQLRQNVELQRSMQLATDVQQALLPNVPPTLPGLDIYGKSRYCDSTGGDYYDYVDMVDLPDHRGALIAVGDVTGHGIGAALLMATARAALRTAAMTPGSNLGEILTRVNRLLSQESEHGLFMTLTIALIDATTGTIRYACAAHDPICCYNPRTKTWRELDEGFLALGAMADSIYEEYRADGIEPGTTIFIGTDGIWEARNTQNEMYGKERMLKMLEAHLDKPAKEAGLAMEADLDAFLTGTKAQDDVTYVLIRM
jgi:serine phosphatase RsbU (regulator of sigma subunit)